MGFLILLKNEDIRKRIYVILGLVLISWGIAVLTQHKIIQPHHRFGGPWKFKNGLDILFFIAIVLLSAISWHWTWFKAPFVEVANQKINKDLDKRF